MGRGGDMGRLLVKGRDEDTDCEEVVSVAPSGVALTGEGSAG